MVVMTEQEKIVDRMRAVAHAAIDNKDYKNAACISLAILAIAEQLAIMNDRAAATSAFDPPFFVR
jgi:hypothetical protein